MVLMGKQYIANEHRKESSHNKPESSHFQSKLEGSTLLSLLPEPELRLLLLLLEWLTACCGVHIQCRPSESLHLNIGVSQGGNRPWNQRGRTNRAAASSCASAIFLPRLPHSVVTRRDEDEHSRK